MDLVDDSAAFDLYDAECPISTLGRNAPPAKIVNDGAHGPSTVHRSSLSNGVVVSGGTDEGSVSSPGVGVHGSAVAERAVLLDDVIVGEGAQVRNAVLDKAVLDKNVVVPPWARIGHDADSDAAHYTVSDARVVVLAKGASVIHPV